MRQRLWQVLAVGIPLAATLLLALTLCSSPTPTKAAQGRPVLGRFTEGTYNVYVFNRATAHDLAVLMRQASLLRLQEVTQRPSIGGVRQALATHPTWRAWWPAGTGLPILWDSRRWAKAGDGGSLQVFAKLPGTVRKPSRYTTWQPLQLRATGQVFLIVNVHAMALACHQGVQPIRERAAALHWATLRAQTVVWRDLGQYSAIVTGGDFNCRLDNHQAWWMPGNQLAGTYWLGPLTKGNHIDWLVIAKGLPAKLDVRRSWYTHTGLHSDHSALLRSVTVVP